jgi:cytochrome c-type biogenesis protein CcmE
MKPKYKRLQLILIAVIISSIGLWLVLKNFNENIVFFFSPTEVKQKSITYVIRVGGIVKKGSIKQDGLITTFSLTDNETNLPISYKGLLPNLFRAEQGIVARGKLVDNIFIADELLAKHDENYMPKEVADSLKKAGTWKGEE